MLAGLGNVLACQQRFFLQVQAVAGDRVLVETGFPRPRGENAIHQKTLEHLPVALNVGFGQPTRRLRYAFHVGAKVGLRDDVIAET